MLTSNQISALNEQIVEFRAADYDAQEKIVEEFLDTFKNACPLSVEFDKIAVGTVSHRWQYWAILMIFLDYSPAYV